MMINELSLTNFQSHKRTHIKLSPGVNAFIGPSDNGKTAILRALYWAFTNRPSGEAFVSHWAKNEKGKQTDPTFIDIITNKGMLTRLKNKEENGYNLDSEEFRAIGTDVPDKILEWLNLSEVNLHRQLDPPFLISASAGEVARFFNKIIDLSVIDDMLGALESKRRKNNQDIKAADVSVEEYTEGLKELGWIEDAQRLMTKMERIEEKQRGRNANWDALDGDTGSIHVYLSNIRDAETILKTESKVDEYVKAYGVVVTNEGERANLMSQFGDHCSLQKAVLDIKKWTENVPLEKTETILTFLEEGKDLAADLQIDISNLRGYSRDVSEAPDFKSLEVAIKKAGTVAERVDVTRKAWGFLLDETSDVKRFTLSIETYETNIQELEDELPEVCPTCGGSGKLK